MNVSFEIVGTAATSGLCQSYFSQVVGMEPCNRLRKWEFYMGSVSKKLKSVIGPFAFLSTLPSLSEKMESIALSFTEPPEPVL